MDATGKEMTAEDLWQLFNQEYLQLHSPFKYVSHHLSEVGEAEQKQTVSAKLQIGQQIKTIYGCGNGPIDAFLNALDLGIRIHSYEERSLNQGSDANAIAYVELAGDFISGSLYGVGIHVNTVTASLLAILSAINRIDRQAQAQLLQRFEQTLVRD